MPTATTMFADTTLGLSAQALAVLHMLAAEDSDDTELRIDTRAWYNCREKGVSLTVRASIPDTKALIIVFAEDRISDQIAIESWVLEGDIPDPPTPRDCRDDAARWEVKYGRVDEATAVIRGLIKSFVETERKVEPLVRVANQAKSRRERRHDAKRRSA